MARLETTVETADGLRLTAGSASAGLLSATTEPLKVCLDDDSSLEDGDADLFDDDAFAFDDTDFRALMARASPRWGVPAAEAVAARGCGGGRGASAVSSSTTASASSMGAYASRFAIAVTREMI